MSFPDDTPDDSDRAPNQRRWLLFAPLAIVVLIAAGGMGVLLHLAYENGFYFIFMAPLVASLPVYWLIHFTTHVSHCRNRWVSGLLGAVAGLVLYLGSYHAGMVAELAPVDPDAIFRIDLLPEYIVERKATEVIRHAHQPGNPNGQQRPPDQIQQGFNWLFFVGELGLVMWICTLAGVSTSRRPYCERCGRWKKRAFTCFRPGAADLLVDVLDKGNADALTRFVAVSPDKTTAYTVVELAQCPPRNGAKSACPVLLSSREVRPRGHNQFDMFGGSWGRVVSYRRPLNQADMELLEPHFPTLTPHLGLDRPVKLSVVVDGPTVLASGLALIELVPEQSRGRVLTLRTKVLVVLIAFLPFLATLTSFVLVTQGTPLWVAAVFGLYGIVFSVIPMHGWLSVRYLRSRIAAEVKTRPDAVVNPDDPKALFIEMVPRTNWHRLMLIDADDVGFLLVDLERREIRFEGDVLRYRIPATAVESCELEDYSSSGGHGGSRRYYYAILRAHTVQGPWEAPLALRKASALFDSTRLKRAEAIREAVSQLFAAEG